MDLNEAANALLKNSPQGKMIQDKKPELEKLAASKDGEKVQQMLKSHGGLEKAIQSGDTEALSKTVRDILSTKEGARLAQQLKTLFK